MSLVIASNQDDELTSRTEQSIYTSYSFRNALSSTYKIPPNSQVCLQSAKVNLDSRITLGGSNGVYYDWFGEALDETLAVPPIDSSTSYPILQQFTSAGRVEELTTEELADLVKANHKEYYPNRMGNHDVAVKRSASNAFEGYEFKYGYNNVQTNASLPSSVASWTYFFDDKTRFTFSSPTFTRVNLGADESLTPAVGIGLGHPLSLSNGSLNVNFADSNASGVEWGVGLSRDCSADPDDGSEEFMPPYFSHREELATTPMLLDNQDYYEDFGVHRNASGELVVRQSSCQTSDKDMLFSEVEYWDNADSDLKGVGRYDIDKNDGNYEYIEFRVVGEKVNLYIGHSGATDLVCQVDTVSDKSTYFKPVQQTCWCLHPILFVGKDDSKNWRTNSLTISGFSGMNITGYNSRDYTAKYSGWYETADLGKVRGLNINTCREVDFRRPINDPTFSEIYDHIGLNASNLTDYTPGMIVSPNDTYTPSSNSAVAELFGFPSKSLVNTGTYSTAGNIVTLSLISDSAPLFANTKSIFVRLNGFGQQVLNAKTGNQSTILAHLPTAEVKEEGLFFYEPNRDVWLDLNNPYEITTTDFSIDFVYSNEQYAKILQGQSIVVLYFRTPK